MTGRQKHGYYANDSTSMFQKCVIRKCHQKSSFSINMACCYVPPLEAVKDCDMVTKNIINQFKIFYQKTNDNSLIMADTNCPADYSNNKLACFTRFNKQNHWLGNFFNDESNAFQLIHKPATVDILLVKNVNVIVNVTEHGPMP